MRISVLESAVSAARSAVTTSRELVAVTRRLQRESLEEARNLLRAAASGDPVDASALVVANAELEIRSARLAVLETEEAQAVEEVDRLEAELIAAELLAGAAA